MPEWPPLGGGQTLAILLVFFVAGIAKGGLGFGLPLVTISVLPLFAPIDYALAINSVVLPLTNIYQYGRSGLAGATLRRFWPVLAGLALGAPVGGVFVASAEPERLTLALGLFVAAFAVLTGFTPRLAIPDRFERPAGVATGVAAGAIGVLTTVNGPVFVTYLVGVGAERRLMVAALGLFFLLSGALFAGSFWLVGVLDGGRLMLAILCLAPAFLGMGVGRVLIERLPAERFRALVLAALFLLGVNMSVRALLAGSA